MIRNRHGEVEVIIFFCITMGCLSREPFRSHLGRMIASVFFILLYHISSRHAIFHLSRLSLLKMERGWDFKENTGCRVLVNDESIKLGQLFFSLRGAKVLLHDVVPGIAPPYLMDSQTRRL